MDFDLTDEQSQAVKVAADLARQYAPNVRVSWEDATSFSWDFYRAIAQQGFTGIDLPEHLGGQALTLLDSVLVIEAVARSAPHLADAIHATNFGAIRQMATHARSAAVEDVVRSVLNGQALPSIAMSEPGAGSAVQDLLTRAVRDGDKIRITGEKTFNTFGPIATHFVVWARFGSDPKDIGAIVVPGDSVGFTRGAAKQFISGEQYSSLYFDHVEVDESFLLIERDGLSKMMSVFNIERLGNAARSLGLGRLALDLATDYLLDRVTGGKRLSDLQGLRWKIAEMRMRLDAAQLLVYRAAAVHSGSLPDQGQVAAAKCMANEAGFFAADTALQLFGGYGFTTESPLEYIWKRTRGWMIAGGSAEVMRNRVAALHLRAARPGYREAKSANEIVPAV